jgi:hypothetical protein
LKIGRSMARAVMLTTAATLAVAVVAATEAHASPANAKVSLSQEVPQVIVVNGESFPTAPLLSAQKYVSMDATTAEIKVLPEAQTELKASTYDELTRLVAALNVADAALRTPQAQESLVRTQPAAVVQPASACTNKFHYHWGNTLDLYIPDCMAYGFAAAVGGPAAVVSFLFSEVGPLEWAAAVSIAGAILAGSAAMTAQAGWCDVFGPGNGIRWSWHWINGPNVPGGYPTLGCW